VSQEALGSKKARELATEKLELALKKQSRQQKTKQKAKN